MKEQIYKIWMSLELGRHAYDTWGDDDLGRLEVIYDQTKNLTTFRKCVSNSIDNLISAQFLLA